MSRKISKKYIINLSSIAFQVNMLIKLFAIQPQNVNIILKSLI